MHRPNRFQTQIELVMNRIQRCMDKVRVQKECESYCSERLETLINRMLPRTNSFRLTGTKMQ